MDAVQGHALPDDTKCNLDVLADLALEDAEQPCSQRGAAKRKRCDAYVASLLVLLRDTESKSQLLRRILLCCSVCAVPSIVAYVGGYLRTMHSCKGDISVLNYVVQPAISNQYAR
jgi:hypothetical protein